MEQLMNDAKTEGAASALSDVLGRLLPCPFCGKGTFAVELNGRVWAGTKYSSPTSVSIRHWCEKIEGQPSRMIERVGRDEESAICIWNMRSNA